MKLIASSYLTAYAHYLFLPTHVANGKSAFAKTLSAYCIGIPEHEYLEKNWTQMLKHGFKREGHMMTVFHIKIHIKD